MLWFCRSKNTNLALIFSHAVVVDIKFFVNFFRRKEWADRQTVNESSSIKFKASFLGEHRTTYLTLTERVNTFVVILPNENEMKFMMTARTIHCGGRHFQVLCEIVSLPQFQGLSNYRRGKIQLNAMRWALISNVTIPLLWYLPIHNGRVTNSTPYWVQ